MENINNGQIHSTPCTSTTFFSSPSMNYSWPHPETTGYSGLHPPAPPSTSASWNNPQPQSPTQLDFQWNNVKEPCGLWSCPFEDNAESGTEECKVCFQDIPIKALLKCPSCRNPMCILCLLQVYKHQKNNSKCPFCRGSLCNGLGRSQLKVLAGALKAHSHNTSLAAEQEIVFPPHPQSQQDNGAFPPHPQDIVPLGPTNGPAVFSNLEAGGRFQPTRPGPIPPLRASQLQERDLFRSSNGDGMRLPIRPSLLEARQARLDNGNSIPIRPASSSAGIQRSSQSSLLHSDTHLHRHRYNTSGVFNPTQQ